MVEEPAPPDYWRTLTVRYLLAQSLGALIWWALMFARPEWRSHFFPDARPELFWSFLIADLPLFIGFGLLAASGLEKRRAHGWQALLVHVGAVVYASLYAIGLSVTTNKAWLGVLLMLPPLLVTPYLAWRMRP